MNITELLTRDLTKGERNAIFFALLLLLFAVGSFYRKDEPRKESRPVTQMDRFDAHCRDLESKPIGRLSIEELDVLRLCRAR